MSTEKFRDQPDRDTDPYRDINKDTDKFRESIKDTPRRDDRYTEVQQTVEPPPKKKGG